MESSNDDATKKEQIKELFKKRQRLSVKTTWRKVKTTELRYYVSLLKKEGLNILSEWVNRGGNRFKEYWLAPEK